MSIVIEDIGEVAYGGLVTLTEWWDTKRIAAGKIQKKELLKQAHFYTYIVIGLGATIVSAMHLWKGKDSWMEHISHGFMYDLPRQAFNAVQALKTPPGLSTTGADSSAVRQARAILEQKAREAAHMRANADQYLNSGNPQPLDSGIQTPIVQPQTLFSSRGGLG
jgi:hypothetical protein